MHKIHKSTTSIDEKEYRKINREEKERKIKMFNRSNREQSSIPEHIVEREAKLYIENHQERCKKERAKKFANSILTDVI
jgi:hypothetical protein